MTFYYGLQVKVGDYSFVVVRLGEGDEGCPCNRSFLCFRGFPQGLLDDFEVLPTFLMIMAKVLEGVVTDDQVLLRITG